MINPIIKLQKDFEFLKDFAIKHKCEFTNEEITKQMLILPFIKSLGYNTKDPLEIKAEFSPSNVSNAFKVDYCIFHNNSPTIFIEAKTYGRNLDRYIDQIRKYFEGSENAEVGVLTNGINYRFFSRDSDTKAMISEPFFTFDLFEYSITDLEILSTFIKKHYNHRDMRLIARESRATNKISKFVYELISNPEAMLDIINNILPDMNQDTLNRIIPISIEKAVIQRGEELEIERDNQVVLKYSEDQLMKLGSYKYIDQLEHDIFIPEKIKFDTLISAKKEDYSVEKGNPFSDFFISKVYKDGKNIRGYLIGQFLDSIDENGEQNMTLYCSPFNNIEKFVRENPCVEESGFINARLQSRKNNSTGKVSYYLQSNIAGISFTNFPKLVSEMNTFEDFYKEFFV